ARATTVCNITACPSSPFLPTSHLLLTFSILWNGLAYRLTRPRRKEGQTGSYWPPWPPPFFFWFWRLFCSGLASAPPGRRRPVSQRRANRRPNTCSNPDPAIATTAASQPGLVTVFVASVGRS